MSQPVNAAPARESPQQEDLSGPPAANRHRLPDERAGITHHFSIAGHEGYLSVGLYPNGQPGEIFIRMAKEGSTIAGLMECFGTVVSVSLQHGVPQAHRDDRAETLHQSRDRRALLCHPDEDFTRLPVRIKADA